MDILFFLQLWGWCNTGHPFGSVNPQQSAHTSHISVYFQVYCYGAGGGESVPSTLPSTPWDRQPISLAKHLPKTVCDLGFFIWCLYYMVTPVSSSIIALDMLVRYSCYVTGWVFLAKFSWIQLAINFGVSFNWMCKFLKPYLVSCVVIWSSPIYWIFFHPRWCVLFLLIGEYRFGWVWFWILPWWMF